MIVISHKIMLRMVQYQVHVLYSYVPGTVPGTWYLVPGTWYTYSIVPNTSFPKDLSSFVEEVHAREFR